MINIQKLAELKAWYRLNGDTSADGTTVKNMVGDDHATIEGGAEYLKNMFDMYSMRFGPLTPTSGDIEGLTTTSNFDINMQASDPHDFYINPDGTKMYIVAYNTEMIYQYTLSTPYDPSTLVYDSKSLDVGPQIVEKPNGILFNSAGTSFYVTSEYSRYTYQYTLGTPWDISTATYYDKFWHYNENSKPKAIFMNPAETKFYMFGTNPATFYEYDMATAGDVTTMTYTGHSFILVVADGANGTSMVLSPDGAFVYQCGQTISPLKINQYNLSTPWDMSTCAFQKELTTAQAMSVFRWHPNGQVAWTIGKTDKKMYVWSH